MKKLTKLWIILAILGVLSPLGLLASGTAWGEWGKDFFVKLIGFVPEGLAKFSDIWNAPFSDYSVHGTKSSIGYMISAFLGMLLVIFITWIISKILVKRHK